MKREAKLEILPPIKFQKRNIHVCIYTAHCTTRYVIINSLVHLIRCVLFWKAIFMLLRYFDIVQDSRLLSILLYSVQLYVFIVCDSVYVCRCAILEYKRVFTIVSDFSPPSCLLLLRIAGENKGQIMYNIQNKIGFLEFSIIFRNKGNFHIYVN